ncbi:hypothetical protein ACQP2T_61560 [Nonomuraea sp. CA-143628]|uniref:hypothetical protein n=1 Tax=Nonomuraea sp. CA-143628 TaxID=3239997 RepID=UPI003D8B1BFD
MSVNMTMDGRIDIEPPIHLTAALSGSRHNAANHKGRPATIPADLVFDIETDPVTGQQIITGLVPAVSFGRKVGSPYAEIEHLMAAHGCGRVFSGTLDITDDEGSTSEITVKDGHVEWSDWEDPQ